MYFYREAGREQVESTLSEYPHGLFWKQNFVFQTTGILGDLSQFRKTKAKIYLGYVI